MEQKKEARIKNSIAEHIATLINVHIGTLFNYYINTLNNTFQSIKKEPVLKIKQALLNLVKV